MTQNKAFKRAVRAEKAASGVPYVVARRATATGDPAPAGEAVVEVPAPSGRGFVITVTSSGSGSSRPVMATMLAGTVASCSRAAAEAGLAERPLKVVVVDMAVDSGPVASLIGKYVPTALNVAAVEGWDTDAVLAHLVHDKRLGVDALLAPVTSAEGCGPDFYRDMLATLRGTHDVIVVNSPDSPRDPLFAAAFGDADEVLYETTLDNLSVQQMARRLRAMTTHEDDGGLGLGLDRKKIGVVVNQSVRDVGMDREQVGYASLGAPLVGAIPLSSKDVLTAQNYCRLHTLLKHPLLAPAYLRLARNCLPKETLVPLYDEAEVECRREQVEATVWAEATDPGL